MSINSTWAISSFVACPGINEEVTSRASYACVQIGVENRDYHHLSHSEIAGDKRISRHLSGPNRPSHLQAEIKGGVTISMTLKESLTRGAGSQRDAIRISGTQGLR